MKTLALGAAAAVAVPLLTEKERMNQYHLGLNPSPEGAVRLRLGDYLVPDQLPPLPDGDFGHQGYVGDWKMLGNGPDPTNPSRVRDGAGDCAFAGPFHAEMLWNAVGGREVNIDADCTLAAYSAVTGFVPGDPSTDNGSDIATVAEYWRTTGLTDADGKVHKIDAYVELHGLRELLYGMYLFDCVGIGVSFPMEWMQAFQQGGTWEALPQATIEGGHFILGVGWVSGYIDTITWGRQQLLSPAGWRQLGSMSVAYLSRERILASGRDLNGLNLDQLLADLEELPNV
jgi:hypothetical protein